jgi:hypothetical protein
MNNMVEEINMALLNKKLDRMIDLFEKTMAILERRKTKKVEDPSTTWSTQEYKNGILVRFSFNLAFKNFVKELGGKWMVAKKAWIFPKSNTNFIQEIKDKFPEWDYKEITENESNTTTDADENDVEID